ncbi:MAG: hypothetical protein ABI120_19815 [Gemmatimonadaceae bacterium]
MNIALRPLFLALTVPLLTGSTNRLWSDPVGCYLASPPFRRIAIDAKRDAARAIIAIEPDGVLRRPSMPRDARIFATWTMRGDSLIASYSDGFTGWRYRLAPTSSSWRGVAQYLTDELMPGDTTASRNGPTTWVRVTCP